MPSLTAVVRRNHGTFARTAIPITPSTRIFFHSLKWSKKPSHLEQYGIVRMDTDEGLLIYPEQLKIIELLYGGDTVGEVCKRTGFTLDSLVGLLRDLAGSGYISRIDTYELLDGFEKIKPMLKNVSVKWFKFLLWKPLLLLEFIFILSGIVLGLMYPRYLPQFSDYYWHPDIFVVVTITISTSLLLGVLHEVVHFCFTKAVGGQGSIKLMGNRFFDFVFETSNYHLILVPRELRYFVYLGGILFDFMTITGILWIFRIADLNNYNLGLISGYLKSIMIIQLLGIIWQFNVYLQTDLYNFFSDFLNLENLYIDTMKYIGLKVRKLRIGNPVKKILLNLFYSKDIILASDDLRSFSHTEKTPLKVYSVFLIFGLCLAIFNLFLISLPRDLIFALMSIKALFRSAYELDVIGIFKYIFSLFLSIYSNILVIYIIVNKISKHKSIL